MEKFLARQPIFNSDKVVYGYELLFRSGPENFFDGSHADAAASAVDNLFWFGIERLTQDRRAFLNLHVRFFSPRFPLYSSSRSRRTGKSSRPFSRIRKSSPPAAASKTPDT